MTPAGAGPENRLGKMRRASSEAVALNTLHKTRNGEYRAALSRAEVDAMADFSAALSRYSLMEYRDQNRLWREGKTSITPKRDFNKPPSHSVTLVYCGDGLKTTWELQLMKKPRPSHPLIRAPSVGVERARVSYESGYATWNMDGTK